MGCTRPPERGARPLHGTSHSLLPFAQLLVILPFASWIRVFPCLVWYSCFWFCGTWCGKDTWSSGWEGESCFCQNFAICAAPASSTCTSNTVKAVLTAIEITSLWPCEQISLTWADVWFGGRCPFVIFRARWLSWNTNTAPHDWINSVQSGAFFSFFRLQRSEIALLCAGNSSWRLLFIGISLGKQLQPLRHCGLGFFWFLRRKRATVFRPKLLRHTFATGWGAVLHLARDRGNSQGDLTLLDTPGPLPQFALKVRILSALQCQHKISIIRTHPNYVRLCSLSAATRRENIPVFALVQCLFTRMIEPSTVLSSARAVFLPSTNIRMRSFLCFNKGSLPWYCHSQWVFGVFHLQVFLYPRPKERCACWCEWESNKRRREPAKSEEPEDLAMRSLRLSTDDFIWRGMKWFVWDSQKARKHHNCPDVVAGQFRMSDGQTLFRLTCQATRNPGQVFSISQWLFSCFHNVKRAPHNELIAEKGQCERCRSLTSKVYILSVATWFTFTKLPKKVSTSFNSEQDKGLTLYKNGLVLWNHTMTSRLLVKKQVVWLYRNPFCKLRTPWCKYIRQVLWSQSYVVGERSQPPSWKSAGRNCFHVCYLRGFIPLFRTTFQQHRNTPNKSEARVVFFMRRPAAAAGAALLGRFRSVAQIQNQVSNLLWEPMTSDQMVSVSPIWQLGHIGQGTDVFAEPPYCSAQVVEHLFVLMQRGAGQKRTLQTTPQRRCGGW